MDTTGQIFQVSKFPNILSFVVTPGMFRQNWTKIGQIYMPYKIAQSGCIPLKIKSKILAHKGWQTTHTPPGDYSPPETANQWDNGTSWCQ